MKLWGKFFLAIFALSLLSYSIPTVAYAAVEPISVTVEEFYSEGDKITISGSVKDFDPSNDLKRISKELASMSLCNFSDELSSDSPAAPGDDSEQNSDDSIVALAMPWNGVFEYSASVTVSALIENEVGESPN